jgi:AraC-like DNA-binding protein
LALDRFDILRAADVVADPRSGRVGHGSRDRSLERVRRMTAAIAEGFASKLTVSEVAEAAGLHPNYAMTLFRRTIGLTIADYLTRQWIGTSPRRFRSNLATAVTDRNTMPITDGAASRCSGEFM